MAGYTRQSSFSDGDTISASLFNNEYNQLLAAFNNATGHKHDGTAAEGPVIALIGDSGLATPLNKVSIDTSNDEIEFHIDVSGTSTEQLKIVDGGIVPITNNDIDLGTSSLQFKDAFFDGTVTLDALTIGSATSITDIDTDLTSVSASDDTLASAKAIKTYIDSQTTAQDLDFQADTGGALSIDLDSETLTFTGGTGIDTSGSGNAVTFAIDSTVATLTGSQILTNKTIDVDNNTVSNIEVDNLKSGVLDTDLTSVASTDTTLASAKAIKSYVDTQVATVPTGDITAVTAGTGLSGGGTTGAVTLDIDSTVATLSGTQTFTNKTIDANGTGNSITNLEVADFASGVVDTALASVSSSDDTLASAKAIKAYVDSSVATANELSELTDVNITSPADGAVLFYDTTSSKWIDNVVSGDITIADTGVASIGSGVIVNADINSSAAIDATKIHDGSVTNAEFGYIGGLTSDAQTQIDSKQATINASNRLNANLIHDGLVDNTEFGYLNGVTSAIQTQIDSKQATIDSSNRLNANLIHDGSVDNTEFGYLNGVTSAIQTQIDSKASAGFAVAMAIAL